MRPRLVATLLAYIDRHHARQNRPAITLPTLEPKMRLPIHLDLAEVFDLAPDVARLVGLLIKAKGKRSDGGKKITELERQELQDALEEALGEIITDGQD